MAKFVLDALNNKLYIDDSQIINLYCEKHYITKQDRIYLKFVEFNKDNFTKYLKYNDENINLSNENKFLKK